MFFLVASLLFFLCFCASAEFEPARRDQQPEVNWKEKQFMRVRHIAGIAFWFALTSAAIAQQRSPQPPTASTTVRSYAVGNVAGFKRSLTRTVSGDRETVTEVIETPSDGRYESSSKTITETAGIGSDHVKTT